MWSTILIGICMIIVWRLWNYLTRGDDLAGIPAVPSPWWNLLKSEKDTVKFHIGLEALAKKYGPILRLPGFFRNPTIMVSSYENIYEVFVKKGKEFGGRTISFHFGACTKNTGIQMQPAPDNKWKTLRMVVQKHMRAFGDGMSESIIIKSGESLISQLESHTEQPCDPLDEITSTAAQSVAQMLLGEDIKSDDPINNLIVTYEKTVWRRFNRTTSQMLLESFPWLRHFGNATWKIIQSELKLSKHIWQTFIDKSLADPNSKNIYLAFKPYFTSTSIESKHRLKEIDAYVGSVDLIQGAVLAAGGILYAAVNILSHHKHIQDKMYNEIQDKIEEDGQITYSGRTLLPYCHATLLELLRYTSLSPVLDHKACTDTVLNGHNIPEGTSFLVNVWNLHHDHDLWKYPNTFRPERFLDECNEVVPADHPNRKHILLFGAGTRVCPGEAFSVTRLFIWLTMIVRHFEILPAPGNNVSSSQPQNYNFQILLKPLPYEVILKRRT